MSRSRRNSSRDRRGRPGPFRRKGCPERRACPLSKSWTAVAAVPPFRPPRRRNAETTSAQAVPRLRRCSTSTSVPRSLGIESKPQKGMMRVPSAAACTWCRSMTSATHGVSPGDVHVVDPVPDARVHDRVAVGRERARGAEHHPRARDRRVDRLRPAAVRLEDLRRAPGSVRGVAGCLELRAVTPGEGPPQAGRGVPGELGHHLPAGEAAGSVEQDVDRARVHRSGFVPATAERRKPEPIGGPRRLGRPPPGRWRRHTPDTRQICQVIDLTRPVSWLTLCNIRRHVAVTWRSHEGESWCFSGLPSCPPRLLAVPLVVTHPGAGAVLLAASLAGAVAFFEGRSRTVPREAPRHAPALALVRARSSRASARWELVERDGRRSLELRWR